MLLRTSDHLRALASSLNLPLLLLCMPSWQPTQPLALSWAWSRRWLSTVCCSSTSSYNTARSRVLDLEVGSFDDLLASAALDFDFYSAAFDAL
jgi:hypothetical protein